MRDLAPTAIVPVRPLSPVDPALLMFKGDYLLPKMLQSLRDQGHVSRIILSLSAVVPQAIQDRLSAWGLELHVSVSDFPQVRIMEIMTSLKPNAAVVLTPYSMLLDGRILEHAWEGVLHGDVDAVYPENVIASRFFMVLNRTAAEALQRFDDYPVPPFAFPAKLKNGNVRIESITGLETSAEQFLWELIYGGERTMLPGEILGPWIETTPPAKRHKTESFHRLLRSVHGLDQWQDLEPFLERLKPFQPVKRLAMMVNYLRRIDSYIPKGGRFLEIGYGKTPITACLLSRLFDSGIAVEPFDHHDEAFTAALAFFEYLSRRYPGWLGFDHTRASNGDFGDRVAFRQSRVEDLELPANSIDFCTSRMVFEHVADPEELSREIYRILKPGGSMLHEIGFNDHEDLSSINFAFLCHSREEWTRMEKGTNLWRISDFTALWEAIGFRVEILTREQRHAPPTSLHPAWQNYAADDLYCYLALIRATKPLMEMAHDW